MVLFKSVAALALALASSQVWAAEVAPNEELGRTMYDTGIVHEQIMAKKMATWRSEKRKGKMNSYQYPTLGYTECKNGVVEAIRGDANNTFRCNNIDLHHFLSHAAMNSTGEGSSSWGWTSRKGREFVAIGQQDGTAFVEITKKGKMEYLGRLPQYSVPSIWREIRSYKDYMIIGSEAVGHGVQIFDMNKLLDLDPRRPKTFDGKKDLTGHFNDLPVGRTHNVVTNEEMGYIVAVGAQPRNSTCRGGLIFIDMANPSRPTTPGCAAQDGYVHDAQCLKYRGPDRRYQGKDICYGYNEDTLTIYDVTDKKNTSIISRTSYEGARYTHQGSLLDDKWQEFLLIDDELDEEYNVGPAAGGFPVTYIWDIRDLAAPKQTGIYKSSVKAIDHNQYVINNLAYQSNYAAGLRVLDVSSVPKDPSGDGVCEAGFFDVYPEDDLAEGGGVVDFFGTWSNYAYFKSGYIFVNSIERGGFVLKMTGKKCAKK